MQTITLNPKWTVRKLPFTIRGEGSDSDVIKEVIHRRCYRKPTIGFVIDDGELWLDVGANIGTFAACCYLHGATAHCYEPEPGCFKLLQKNVGNLEGFQLFNTALTTSKAKVLASVKSNNPDNHYRLTFQVSSAPERYVDGGKLPNRCIADIRQRWDGIKLDIEGSELAMIDEEMLPTTNKLVMEYHFSRDEGNMSNFHRRMKVLRKLFNVVSYPPSLNKIKKGKYPGRFDINVFCINS